MRYFETSSQSSLRGEKSGSVVGGVFVTVDRGDPLRDGRRDRHLLLPVQVPHECRERLFAREDAVALRPLVVLRLGQGGSGRLGLLVGVPRGGKADAETGLDPTA
ncbi:uncharacterized protein PG998_012732 [Apiospora kogelbergensis]|uniref:uncharacterized protein n=1 Tax=Apiospora kogelbergensis TaxID=1337665 RepID=UPI003130B078